MRVIRGGALVTVSAMAAVSCSLWGADGQEARCGNLLKLKIANTVLSEAVLLPAGKPLRIGGGYMPAVEVTSLPAHCLVHGEVNRHKGANGKEYGDRFEIRMPMEWQGRLLFMGGGGLDGVLNPAIALQGAETKPDSKSALSLGYAVVTTDGGHEATGFGMGDGSFGSDPVARADYNYRSTKLVTDVAEMVIAEYYGSRIRHSYFKGCSNGGREGLMTAERYPEMFDGVIAGAPAFNLTHAAIAEAWNTDELASIAPKKADGSVDLTQSLTEGDLQLLVGAVLDKCDALDGLKDGLIFNPEACHFEPSTLKCAAGQSADCLPAEKVKVVEAIFQGPLDSRGAAIYSPWPFDSGDAAEGWRIWMTGVGQTPSVNVMIFPAFFNGLAVPDANPKIDIFHFDFDRDSARLHKPAEDINATSTDWTAFRGHHGKLLLYTGMSDPVFSALDLIGYYKELEGKNGGAKQAHDFARLFLVPGMNHCSGGPGLDDFDTLSAMQRWVEDGVAPERMISSGKVFPGRTRPLCAFPQFAQYDGKGNPEDAASFACKEP